MAHDVRSMTSAGDPSALGLDRPSEGSPIHTAIVDDISPDGVPRVVLTGESHPRDAASLVKYESAAAASAALLGQPVLVTLGPNGVPIILGAITPTLWDRRGDDVQLADARGTLPSNEPIRLQAGQRQISLEAADEIRLTCGKSALVMRRDGTVIVRGVKITSRATETHRIMGGTVGIN